MSKQVSNQEDSRFAATIKFKTELASKIAEASRLRKDNSNADYISESVASYISIEDGVEYLVVVRIFGENPIELKYEVDDIVSEISLKCIRSPELELEDLIKKKGATEGDVKYIKELVQSNISENFDELKEKAEIVEKYKAENPDSSLASANPELVMKLQLSKDSSKRLAPSGPKPKPLPVDNDLVLKILAVVGLLAFWYLVGEIRD